MRIDFTERGYHQFKPSSLHNPNISRCWQRRFEDDVGKKYFIDINEWDNAEMKAHMSHPENCPDFSYEYELQMYAKDTHDAINLTFLSSWDIERVEAFVEKLWATGEFDYYEKWED